MGKFVVAKSPPRLREIYNNMMDEIELFDMKLESVDGQVVLTDGESHIVVGEEPIEIKSNLSVDD